MLSVALSLSFGRRSRRGRGRRPRTVGVTHHRVLWSPDFPLPGARRGGAVAIGNFDGVHRGHAALLAELRARARAVGGPAVALTFDPHPLALLRPERLQPLLTAPADRARLLHELGADHILILR